MTTTLGRSSASARWHRPLRALAASRIRSHTLWRMLQQHGLLFVAVVLGTTATSLTSTLPGLAIPLLGGEFVLRPHQAQWTNAAFLLPMAGSMLATPGLLQRLSLPRVYGLAISLLLMGTVLCGLAASFPVLLAGRMAQGLATGVLQPMPALVVLRHSPPHLVGRVTGLLGTLPTLAVAVGPGIAGVLMAAFGWRAVFWLPLPMGLAAWWLVRAADRRGAYPPDAAAEPAAPSNRLDLPGLLLVNIGLTALLTAIVQWRTGQHGLAVGLLVTALVCTGALLWWQRRLHAQAQAASGVLLPAQPAAGRWLPLMNPGLLRQGLFGRGCVASMLYGALLYGSTYLLPQWMAQCTHLGVASAGAALMVAGLAMMVGMLLAGRQLDRRPGIPLVSLGFGLMAVSLVLLSWFGQWGWGFTAVSAAVGRLGLGLALAALYVTALRSLPAVLAAQGASLSNFMQTVGGALGAAASGARAGLAADAACDALLQLDVLDPKRLQRHRRRPVAAGTAGRCSLCRGLAVARSHGSAMSQPRRASALPPSMTGTAGSRPFPT